MSIKTNLAEQFQKIIITALTSELSLSEDLSHYITETIYEKLQIEYGGSKIYIPIREIDIKTKIKKEFNGRNHNELCTKYDISLSTLYRIIRQF